jgi:peptidyl-prolyl cis-trans isomerase C
MLHLRGALLGLALTSLTAMAQTPPATPPARPPAPAPAPAGTAKPPATPLPAPTATVSPTVVAATVNGEAIYELAVQRALERVPPARRNEERPRLIDYLVDNLLIDQSLRTAGWKVESAEVEKKVNEMKTELKKVGKDFDKMLAELKVTEAELRSHIAADLRWFKYVSAQASDKALTELFTGNKDMFDGTQVKARHILLVPAGKDDKATAAAVAQIRQLKKDIEAEVEAGLAKLPATTDKLSREKARTALLLEAFAKRAKEKSECPTKNNGGDVGWFQKAGFIVAPFSQAAFALQPYQMSDAVQTPFGYHLILVTERKPGREVKFDDVKEVVKEVYFDREHERLAGQLRQKANIVVQPAPK